LILLSVGTQFPFDRLVRLVDDWAFAQGRTDVMAQVGPSKLHVRAVKPFGLVSPSEFRDLQASAQVTISHAGMGSILTALECGKPIIVMPRDHQRGEHRNDHQVATARKLEHTPGVYVAWDDAQLLDYLGRLHELAGATGASAKAPEAFTLQLKSFIRTG